MEPTVMEKLRSIRTDLRQHMERAGMAVLERRDITEERVIAKGGYGRVIKGTIKSDGSRVVIKRILASKYDVAQVKLFAKETKLLSMIKHPNIVSLLAVCIEPTSFSPIMEYMEYNLEQLDIHGLRKGNNLAELIDVLVTADLVEEIGVKRGVLHKAAVHVVTGLAFLHRNDICHGDVKPTNILVTNTGDLFTFKLADFGEARATNIETESVPHEKTYRAQRGTIRFFAPEQMLESLMSAPIATLKRIDIWNLGMVIFCLLSPDINFPWDNDLPSQHDQDKVMKARMANRQLPKGSDRYEHLSDQTGLGDLYKMCCQFDPASRPNIKDIQYKINNLTAIHNKTGISASPAAAAEHVDSGAQAGVVPENAEQHPHRGFESETMDHPANTWRSQIEALRAWLKKSDIQILALTDVVEVHEIGRGGYGVISKGELKADHSRVVLKQMLDYRCDEAHLKLFSKEIKLLAKTTVKNAPNIVRLRGVCLQPPSAIVEYLEFSLDDTRFRGMMASVKGNNTLAHLLRILHGLKLVEEVGVKQRVLHKAAVDVATGLAFLHENDICHRDLKTSNVLATNSGKSFLFKLTDFGESRARDLQTASLHTTTGRVQRGTELYFAPEVFMEKLRSADILDLKRVDIWAYGMILFCLLSPDLGDPWKIERRPIAIEKAMTEHELPTASGQYNHLPRDTGLGKIYTICCDYDPICRPAMNDVVNKLTKMTDSHKKTGSSASQAAAAEHVL